MAGVIQSHFLVCPMDSAKSSAWSEVGSVLMDVEAQLAAIERLLAADLKFAQESRELVERRLGRLEQLINVVLEKQDKSVDKIERRIGYAMERVEYQVGGLKEELSLQAEEAPFRAKESSK